jgi:hypothetical protein
MGDGPPGDGPAPSGVLVRLTRVIGQTVDFKYVSFGVRDSVVS